MNKLKMTAALLAALASISVNAAQQLDLSKAPTLGKLIKVAPERNILISDPSHKFNSAEEKAEYMINLLVERIDLIEYQAKQSEDLHAKQKINGILAVAELTTPTADYFKVLNANASKYELLNGFGDDYKKFSHKIFNDDAQSFINELSSNKGYFKYDEFLPRNIANDIRIKLERLASDVSNKDRDYDESKLIAEIQFDIDLLAKANAKAIGGYTVGMGDMTAEIHQLVLLINKVYFFDEPKLNYESFKYSIFSVEDMEAEAKSRKDYYDALIEKATDYQ